MEVVHPRCAGLDVHKDSVVACIRLASANPVQQLVRTFPTHTSGLMELSEWLSAQDVTHIAMEATGVYWKPGWHVLEATFTLVLANAAHIRNLPGRKTDVNDAMWIADLLAHGLIRGSFVPPTPIQELRDLTRTRKQLVREIAQHTLRIEKTLEDANLKITALITDILGVSGRAMLQAIVDGQSDPERLADLARGRLKTKRSALIEALRGRLGPTDQPIRRPWRASMPSKGISEMRVVFAGNATDFWSIFLIGAGRGDLEATLRYRRARPS